VLTTVKAMPTRSPTPLAVDSFIEVRSKTGLIMHHDASTLRALGLIPMI
jgi:hypothetical protein